MKPEKTTYEKMVSGDWYNAGVDSQNTGLMWETQRLQNKYNALDPDDAEGRDKLLRQLCGSVGEGCLVLSPFYCDYGKQIHFGNHVFLNKCCQILDEAEVRFGNHVFVGPMVGFHTAIHPIDAAERRKGIERAEPIVIGNDVWIGAQACILAGVHIGDGSVIGAGSVVTKDIPAGVVAAGNPCRVIRKIDGQNAE